MGREECRKIDAATVTIETAIHEAMSATDALVAAAAKSDEFGRREQGAIWNMQHSVEQCRASLQEPDCLRAIVFDLTRAINELHRGVGAPGDYGYGTPEGDALSWLYESTRLLGRFYKVGAPPPADPAEPVTAAAAVEGT